MTSIFTQNFWNAVKRVTHRDVINQLKQLTQISTDVGLCRVSFYCCFEVVFLSLFFPHANFHLKFSESEFDILF